MNKKRGLGRGLSALLDDPATELATAPIAAPRSVGVVGELAIAQIEPNPFQPRTTFSSEALMELAMSIRELGVIQPVTVRRVGIDRHQLISGERRFRAAEAAGLTHIPAFIRVANDEAMLEMALVENIQREDLDAIEVAISFKRLIDEVGLTQEQLSGKVGKDRTTVTNYLRLLKLPPEIQLGIRQKQITMGHARALINVPDPARQLELYRRIVESQLSVREAEHMTRETQVPAQRGKGPRVAANHRQLARQLSERYEAKVKVKSDVTGKGRIEIAFRDTAELARIKGLLER